MRKKIQLGLLALWAVLAAAASAGQPRPIRTDRYGDPLPPGALARLGTIRLRSASTVYPLPERDAFLSVSSLLDRSGVCHWQLSTGKLLRRLSAPTSMRTAFDGRTLAIAAVDELTRTNRVVLWDVASDKKTGEIAVAHDVRGLALSPDGKTLATAGPGKTVYLWDRKSRAELRRLQAESDGWWNPVFSPDGKILAAAGLQHRTVQLWDAATGRSLHILGDGIGLRSNVAFSPDGKTLATGDGKSQTVRLWDTATGKQVREFPSTLPIHSLAFSPDGKILAAGGTLKEANRESLRPSTIHLWDTRSGRLLHRLPGHTFSVVSLAFTADSKKLLSAGSSAVAKVWDMAAGKELLPFDEHESFISALAYSPDGRFLATGSLDGTLRLWEASTGKPLRALESERGPMVTGLAFAPDGRSLISTRFGGTLYFWDAAAGRLNRRLKLEEDDQRIRWFACLPDGQTLAVRTGAKSPMRLLDAATGAEKRRLTVGTNDSAIHALSPDGRQLAALNYSTRSRGGILHLWNLADGKELRKWTLGERGLLVFSPDGQTLLGGAGDSFLPNGQEERTFHRWDIATGKDRPFTVSQHAHLQSLAVSPDGRMLAWGDDDGTITLFELTASQVRRRLQGHASHARTLAFSPDGRSLASGGGDSTALIWDVTGRPDTPRTGTLSAQELRALWDDLANKDAAKAFDAIGMLTASPEQAVPLLKDNLRPAPAPADRERVVKYIADLDSDEFAVRKKAMTQLRQLGEGAEPALRQAQKEKRTPEARKRIEELLAGIRVLAESPARLRELRGVEVLEHIGTAEARQVLQTLAQGASHARLTREAKAALQRQNEPRP